MERVTQAPSFYFILQYYGAGADCFTDSGERIRRGTLQNLGINNNAWGDKHLIIHIVLVEIREYIRPCHFAVIMPLSLYAVLPVRYWRCRYYYHLSPYDYTF